MCVRVRLDTFPCRTESNTNFDPYDAATASQETMKQRIWTCINLRSSVLWFVCEMGMWATHLQENVQLLWRVDTWQCHLGSAQSYQACCVLAESPDRPPPPPRKNFAIAKEKPQNNNVYYNLLDWILLKWLCLSVLQTAEYSADIWVDFREHLIWRSNKYFFNGPQTNEPVP